MERVVRAKFVVRSINKEKYGPGSPEVRTVTLVPVYSNDPESENKKFWDATPSGEVKLGVVNLAAAELFELGAEYYLDFTKAVPLAPAENQPSSS